MSERLEHDRHQDLPPGRADRAQHPELTRPLSDGDGERVEDDERADEQGDEAEDEQSSGQEAEDLREVLGRAAAASSSPVRTSTARPDLRAHAPLEL